MGELRVIDYSHEGVALRGELALPAGRGPHPGVLVMHDAHGLGRQVRERAQRLAQAGYAALASDMYGGGRRFDDPRDCAPLITELHASAALLRGRAQAGLQALLHGADVDPARVGAIGFCFGGQCVLELARSGAALGAVVSFHGLLQTQAPARAGEVKAKVMALCGAKDPYAPAADIAAFQAEMTEAGADWQTTLYGEAFHAFTDPEAGSFPVPGVRYDPLVDRLSWSQATALLEAAVQAA
jgi:dienelactone hydrolase